MGNYAKVCVIGLGYVGLPTALLAASSGYTVVGFDCNSNHVYTINKGMCSFKERGLVRVLHDVLQQKKFYAVTVIESADYFVIAVPTPLDTDTMQADLRCVYAAVDSVVHVIRPGNTIILESTVPVGTLRTIAQKITKKTGLCLGKDFFCAYSPERVLPGKIIQELQENERVIGCLDQESGRRAEGFYSRFVYGACTVVQARVAELVKLLENSYRDVQIAFAHQVAQISQACSVDPFELISVVNRHPRVNILKPSAGVGGHCIALDPWFLISAFPEQTKLLRSARITNDLRPDSVFQSIERLVALWCTHNTGICTVACLGATYKPDVDDMRQSPAHSIVRKLIQKKGLTVLVVEPYGHVQEKGVRLVGIEQALCADIIVCLVAHTCFEPWRSCIQSHEYVYDACGFLYTKIDNDYKYNKKKGKSNETSCS